MATTYEEAKQCPKCGKTGEVVQKKPSKNRRGHPVELHIIFCRTELCVWLNTSWVVQVNEDGSIPDAYSGLGPKQFPKVSQETLTRIEEGVQAQLGAETRPGGGELKGRG